MYKLGTLAVVRTIAHAELVGQPVASALRELDTEGVVGVASIDPNLSDTAAFCERYEVPLDQAANCVVLEAKRGDATWLAACVVLGDTRADVNGLVRKQLDARRVSFAPMSRATAESGMEYGAITPVGLPRAWHILIDKTVVETECLVIGSGVRSSKLVLPGAFLATLPNVQVLQDLGRPASVDTKI